MRICIIALIMGPALFCFTRAAFGEDTFSPNPREGAFESKVIPTDWETSVYGAKPTIDIDDNVKRENPPSLRISATEPSDTALGKEVKLTPGQWYRFSGWVKTRQLKGTDANTLGTLQVQNPRGQGIIASGPNHRGDTDWTETSVYFQAPDEGQVRLCIFFAGFGKGTGTAWFDGLNCQEIDLTGKPIRVTQTPLCAGRISPLQYGQFVEYLCNLVPGMWAEKLYDGSFEGLSPYKFEFIKETDFKEKPWYPSGQVNGADYSLDRTTKISGEVSRKIHVPTGPPCQIGLSQDGIFVDTSQACDFKCWFRAEGLNSTVRVSLHHDNKVFASAEFQPTGEWRKYSTRMAPMARDVNATLTIEFRGPGTLWLDNASLMPLDNVGGWRRDVLEAVRALKPGVIRFGGSSVDADSYASFDWKDTIGDPDRRRPFRAWGGLQPTGPGLEEIVQFCRRVGAEPLICVRFTQRKPQDAAAEVEYFNGTAGTPMGAQRARNGHPEPYHIKYWQIGNELLGRDYEAGLAAFCQAMKAVDPTIKLLSSFPTAELIKQAGPFLDYVCPHHYSHDLVWMENDLEAIQSMIRENAPGRSIQVGVTEWNTTAGDSGTRRAMLWTLSNALACSRYHNLMHRHCDLVEIANRSNLINSFCSGIIQTDNHHLFRTPTYYAQQLYATLAGQLPLEIESEIPANAGLDLSATLSADGKQLVLFAVNATLKDITRPLDLSAFGQTGQKMPIWTLEDRKRLGEPEAANSFAEPLRICPVQSALEVSSARFDYCFRAQSLTVIRWLCE